MTIPAPLQSVKTDQPEFGVELKLVCHRRSPSMPPLKIFHDLLHPMRCNKDAFLQENSSWRVEEVLLFAVSFADNTSSGLVFNSGQFLKIESSSFE